MKLLLRQDGWHQNNSNCYWGIYQLHRVKQALVLVSVWRIVGSQPVQLDLDVVGSLHSVAVLNKRRFFDVFEALPNRTALVQVR